MSVTRANCAGKMRCRRETFPTLPPRLSGGHDPPKLKIPPFMAGNDRIA